MTDLQKEIFDLLLSGHHIVTYPGRWRLRDPENRPVRNITSRGFDSIKRFLRKTKTGKYLIDKREVRALHGNNWLKKKYKSNGKDLH